jgi:hypothetical protein
LNGKFTGKPAFQDFTPDLYKKGKFKGIWKIFPWEIENLKRLLKTGRDYNRGFIIMNL